MAAGANTMNGLADVSGIGARRSLWKLARHMISPSPGPIKEPTRPHVRQDACPVLAACLRIAPARSPDLAHRILHIGPLSPESGAADFLNCGIAWAEQNPGRVLDLCWIGDGDLLGVLRAQPLPPNLLQRFAGELSPLQVVSRFGQSGILAVPSLGLGCPPYLVEAMAAGLVMLGSLRNPAVRSLVVNQDSGWLFDPHSPPSMVVGLNAALCATPESLDMMRGNARARAIGFMDRTRPTGRTVTDLGLATRSG